MRSIPPAARKVSARGIMEFLSATRQVGFPRSIRTYPQLGYSVAACRSADFLFGSCEGDGSIFVRLEGNCAHIAVLSGYSVGAFSVGEPRGSRSGGNMGRGRHDGLQPVFMSSRWAFLREIGTGRHSPFVCPPPRSSMTYRSAPAPNRRLNCHLAMPICPRPPPPRWIRMI